jgi:membrane-associated phospholipid phosphatase
MASAMCYTNRYELPGLSNSEKNKHICKELKTSMNQNKHKITDNTFTILFFMFWIFSLVLLFLTTRGDVVLRVNSISRPQWDPIFGWITQLGHGMFAVVIMLILAIFKSYKTCLHVGFSLLFVAIFTNLAKKVLFLQHYRPMWVFYYSDFTRVIYDAPLNFMRSFPSGHTMTAFALTATLAFIFNKRIISLFLFFVALLVGLSRIYLCQHFFVDVVWGAMLGMASAIFGAIAIGYVSSIDKKQILERPLWQHAGFLFKSIKNK